MDTTVNKGILLESGTNELEIIELYLDEEGGTRNFYGINVAKVIEIITIPTLINKPPNAAPFVAGVFNHRGKVIVLVDLALWLGRKRMEGGNPIAVITEFNKTTSAFLVSGVTRIHRSSWAAIKPVDSYLQNYCEAVTGMILLENKIVLMLDLERIIGELDPRLAVPQFQEGEAEQTLSNTATCGTEIPSESPPCRRLGDDPQGGKAASRGPKGIRRHLYRGRRCGLEMAGGPEGGGRRTEKARRRLYRHRPFGHRNAGNGRLPPVPANQDRPHAEIASRRPLFFPDQR